MQSRRNVKKGKVRRKDSPKLDLAIQWSIRMDQWSSRMIAIVSLLLLLLVGFSYYDMYRFTHEGMNSVEYRSFEELRKINPDVVAWLTLDGTAIDHPVVQGKDNFEYLDKDFYGKDYAGGTLFLDEQCSSDFEDEYQVIHGHHMAGGTMFGDLKKYLQKDFFQENQTGQLLTPMQNYNLEILGVGLFDAYDTKLYRIDGKMSRPLQAFEKCKWRNNQKPGVNEKLLALSTCSGDMDDRRIVLFCAMKKRSN